MNGGVKILSVRGIPIRLHWTFFLILPYVAFMMAKRFAAFAASAHTTETALLLSPGMWGLLLAVLLFVSVLLHELGHVFVALAQGSKVREVTLMLLGGISHIESVSHAPRAEAKMAIVGPLVSIAIAVVAYVAHLFSGDVPDLQFGLYYLAQINLGIGIFNMLPAFPLDGGRVLRSMLATKYGRLRATAMAASVGRVLAVMMGILGLFSGNFLMALIAVFIWAGGNAEALGIIHRERLAKLRVGDLVENNVPVIHAAETIARASEVMLHDRASALLVRGPGGMGIITAEQIAGIAPRFRSAATVDAVALGEAPVADANDIVADVVEAMDARGLRFVPVVRGDQIIGVLSRENVERFLKLDSMLRTSLVEPPPGRRSTA
jgi:Zn-dependent protease/CBS domain-containing protein